MLVGVSLRMRRRHYQVGILFTMVAAGFMINTGLALLRKRFRLFLHHPQEITATLTTEGFTRVLQATAGPSRLWEAAVYRRQ